MNIPAWAKEWTEKGWKFFPEGESASFETLRRHTADGREVRVYDNGEAAVNIGLKSYRQIRDGGRIHDAIYAADQFASEHGGWKEPGTSPERPDNLSSETTPLIASNQNDDLAGLPTPREGYQWEAVGVNFAYVGIHGDMVNAGINSWLTVNAPEDSTEMQSFIRGIAIGQGYVARQVPTPEPEGPEVIWGPMLSRRILDTGEFQIGHDGGRWVTQKGHGATIELAKDFASLYAKDKANTALLDSFYELGERAAGWLYWKDGDPPTEPAVNIAADLAKAYKEAKGDA